MKLSEPEKRGYGPFWPYRCPTTFYIRWWKGKFWITERHQRFDPPVKEFVSQEDGTWLVDYAERHLGIPKKHVRRLQDGMWHGVGASLQE